MSLLSHPIAEVFPLLPVEELRKLVDDIRANGLQEPIWLYEGKILDGRHRYMAHNEVEPSGWGRFPAALTREWNGECGTPEAFALSRNLHRRHLSAAERAVIGAKLLPRYEEAAKERKAATQLTGKGSVPRPGGAPIGEAVDLAGAALHVSGDSVARAAVVLAKGAEGLVSAVQSGAVGLKDGALVAAGVSREQQAALLEHFDPKTVAAKAKQLRDEKARARREKKQGLAEQLRAKPLPLPDGQFDIIEADFPWKHELREEDESHRGKGDYPRMSLAEICTFAEEKVKPRMGKSCIVFLWWLNEMMVDTVTVIQTLGLKQVGNITWRKVTKASRGQPKRKSKMGMGTRIRNVTEHCAICIKGAPLFLGESIENHFEAEIREHSRKPEEAYRLIETLCPGTKLQLFGREKRKGWVVWGAEADKFESEKPEVVKPKGKAVAESAVKYCLAPKCMVREGLTQGLCSKHYEAGRATREPARPPIGTPPFDSVCWYPDCKGRCWNYGLCQAHGEAAEAAGLPIHRLTGAHLKKALEKAATAPAPKAPSKRSGAPVQRSPASCLVAQCPRKALAHKLCSSHNKKRLRLGLTRDPLTISDLVELAKDGRQSRGS